MHNGSPLLAIRLHFEDPIGRLNVQDQSVDATQNAAQQFTSTPKPDGGTYSGNSHGGSMRTSAKAGPGSSEGKQSAKSFGLKIKPATYDRSSSWKDYKAHIEV